LLLLLHQKLDTKLSADFVSNLCVVLHDFHRVLLGRRQHLKPKRKATSEQVNSKA